MARADTNGTTTAAAYNDLEKQIATLKGDIAKLTETVGTYGRAQGRELKSTAAATAELARAKGQEAAAVAQEQATAAYHATEDKVRENPAAAVGIAAGFGFLVGLIASRRG